jgi:hypothetical protein
MRLVSLSWYAELDVFSGLDVAAYIPVPLLTNSVVKCATTIYPHASTYLGSHQVLNYFLYLPYPREVTSILFQTAFKAI